MSALPGVLTAVETPYGTLYVDPEELIVGRLLQANGEIPDISAEVAFIRRFLHAGDTAIDVGANWGLFTLAMAQIVGPAGHVLAVDPNTDFEGAWEHTVRRNDLAQVETGVWAFGRERSVGALRMDDRGSGGTQVLIGPGGMVPVVAIDDLVWHRPIRFIKIDAEGMDVDILLGAERTLREDRPAVLFEWNTDAMRALGKDPKREVWARGNLMERIDYGEWNQPGAPKDCRMIVPRRRREHPTDL